MPATLTETKITAETKRAATIKKRVELTDSVLPGLRLRITPAGRRTWVLGCRDQQGRPRRFNLGEHPAIGISDARDAARATRHKVRMEGADPIADRRRTLAAAKDAAEGRGTLAALLDAYGAADGTALKSWSHSRLRVERVFAGLLKRPIATLTVADLLLAADSYDAKSSAAFAVRTLRPVLKWGTPRGLAPAGLDVIRMRQPARRRHRVLSTAELAKLLPVLRTSARPHAAALRLMLLTLARREEVCGARWRDVDLEAATWLIPVTKNGEPHQVPLSRQAVDLLAARKPPDAPGDQLVFAVAAGRKRGSVSAADRSSSAEAGPRGGLGSATPADMGASPTGRLGNWDRETKAFQAASGTRDWHRHDLRRTGATRLGELGELPDIVEAALNHTAIRSPLAANYNRSRYRPQVAVALQRLADDLDAIEPGAPAQQA